MTHNINKLEPNQRLYKAVRGGFITAGTSLTSWCRNNGVNPSNARHCLIGSWDGPKAKELRKSLVMASGILHSSTDLIPVNQPNQKEVA
ncbi:hypothetical protein [Neptuniibacter marinus]|uniref:hypothetical protein n=1 Tax=Neptuniibacter marinus TaxID=1806670 RepID=UPI00082FAEA5|nr:hypothetical protein [Neptuniibacter marinus]